MGYEKFGNRPGYPGKRKGYGMKDELTREDRTELFLMQVRGSLATAFLYANIKPTTDEMCRLYDMGEMTMREMGEIAGRTGFNLNLQLHDIKPLPQPPEVTE